MNEKVKRVVEIIGEKKLEDQSEEEKRKIRVVTYTLGISLFLGLTFVIWSWFFSSSPLNVSSNRVVKSDVEKCFVGGIIGYHQNLAVAVKKTMHNPDSFKVVSTIVKGQEGSSERAIIMTYRGTNAFGGVVTQTAAAMLYLPSCRIDIIRLD